jgi:hypothetical protein
VTLNPLVTLEPTRVTLNCVNTEIVNTEIVNTEMRNV